MRKLILDSSLATNGNTSQPLWRFSQGIRVGGIRVNSMILPLSWNNVHERNNVISFGDGNMERTATLKPGQYSATELADEVARALSSGGTQSYTVSFDPISGKLNISAPSTFRFVYNYTSAAKVLGLTSDTSPVTAFTSHDPVDLTGTQLILLNSPEISARGSIIYAGRESIYLTLSRSIKILVLLWFTKVT